jgi:hypothetical protein
MFKHNLVQVIYVLQMTHECIIKENYTKDVDF